MRRQCRAVTRKNRKCPIEVEMWREQDFCHVHDPNGKYRQQHPYDKPRKRSKKHISGALKQNIIIEMTSKKCTSDPNMKYCLSEDGIHCDTIDYMIEIVTKA